MVGIDNIEFVATFQLLRSYYLNFSYAFPFKYKFKQDTVSDDNFAERGKIVLFIFIYTQLIF